MDVWANMISSLGFPIVCCLACGYMLYHLLNKVMSDSKEREDRLMNLTRDISTKIAELGGIVDKNTEAISIMNEKLEKLSKEVEDVNNE